MTSQRVLSDTSLSCDQSVPWTDGARSVLSHDHCIANSFGYHVTRIKMSSLGKEADFDVSRKMAKT